MGSKNHSESSSSTKSSLNQRDGRFASLAEEDRTAAAGLNKVLLQDNNGKATTSEDDSRCTAMLLEESGLESHPYIGATTSNNSLAQDKQAGCVTQAFTRITNKNLVLSLFFCAVVIAICASTIMFSDMGLLVFHPSKMAHQNSPSAGDDINFQVEKRSYPGDRSRELQDEEEEMNSCALSEETPFVFHILVELDSPDNCAGPSIEGTFLFLSANDRGQLENTLLASYSKLQQLDCDPYFRNISSVEIGRQGTSPSSDGRSSITLEIKAIGTLRCKQSEEGCNVDGIGLFTIPGQGYLHEPTACLCPAKESNNTATVASNRGPTEAEFMEHFGARLAKVAPFLDCSDLQVAPCAFSTIFQSALAVTFADPDAAKNAGDLIGSEALKILNDLYAPNDPNICYPEFRVFDSVSVVFQEARSRLEEIEKPTSSPTNLSSVPTSLVNRTEPSLIGNISTSAPSMSPSSIIGDAPGPQPLTFIMYIGGVCSQCASYLFFSNDVSARRRRLEALSLQHAMLEDRPGGRKLQTINSTKSNCFCPIDSVVGEAPVPAIEQFESALEERLQLEITQIQQLDPNDIDVMDEGSFTSNATYRYSCTDISSQFKKNVTLDLQVTCGGAPGLSDDDKNRIGLAYVLAYNSLRTTVCDPFNLEAVAAKVVQIGDLRAGGNSLPLRIEVTMICYGCNPLGTNIYGFPDVLLEEEATGINATRRYLYAADGLTTCTCNSTLPRRAPLEADVTDALDRTFVQHEDLLPTCIGSTSTCDFGTTFTASALFKVQDDSTLDPLEIAQILESAYARALDRLIGGGNATVCNNLFGIVTDTEVYLNFVYNSVDRTANETARRQLQELPSVAPTADSTFTFSWSSASGANTSDAPTAAPTIQVVEETGLYLLDAFGVCNGCPAELIFSNAADGRRQLDQIKDEDKISTTSMNEYRSLQDILGGEEPESDCYCPIGSVEVATNFEQISLLDVIQEEVVKISNTTTVTGIVSGLTRVDCVEETPFSTTIDFRFSAFRWVVDNPDDVQGLGDAIAKIYNRLVDEFCDEYFRNSISLTYVPGSLQRSSSSAARRLERDLQNMQGCLNFRATFTVTGACRGCQALGTPIPIFGDGITSNRRLDEIITRASKPSRQEHRLLQEAGSTCVCDSTSISQRSAPSLAAIRAGLEVLIPDQLPWAKNPSICGNAVDVEIPCPTIPAGPSATISLQFFARRSDGKCLRAADLQVMATEFSNAFNENMKLQHFPCEPQYLQVSNVIIDPSALGGCRRELLRDSENENDGKLQDEKTSRQLLQDFDVILASMTATGNIYAVNIGAILASEGTTLRAAAAIITETTGGTYEIITGRATSSPSAEPSAFPSSFPSAFPSSFPSAFPSSIPSEKCPTSSESCTGNVSEVQAWCNNSFTGPEICCSTPPNAVYVACEWTGDATIFKGASNGDGACWFADTSTSTTVGANSCNGELACDEIGYDFDTDSHTATSISIGSNSCNGDSACNSIARFAGDTISIGDGSCNEDHACLFIGISVAETVTVDEGSCIGVDSCYAVGRNEAVSAIIGADSCIGAKACKYLGMNEATSVTISKKTCTAKACGNVDDPICGGAFPGLYNALSGDVTCVDCNCTSSL